MNIMGLDSRVFGSDEIQSCNEYFSDFGLIVDRADDYGGCFFAVSSFFMFLPNLPVYRTGLKFAGMGGSSQPPDRQKENAPLLTLSGTG